MTTTSSDTYSVQDLAQEVIRSFKEAGNDTARRLDLIRDPLRRFTSRPDVDELKMVKRFSPHTENSRYLYFDGKLSISYNHLPMGEVTPVHDHGNDRGYHLWEILVLYRGRLDHVMYRRRDDRSVTGHADLEVVDKRVLGPGDAIIVGPPAEVHGFRVVADPTYLITIVDGAFPPEREYYNPEQKRVVCCDPKEFFSGKVTV